MSFNPAQGLGLAGDAKAYNGVLKYPVRRLHTDTTSYTTTGTSTEVAATYTVPAGVLNAEGRVLRVTVQGTTAANTNGKTAGFGFGATTRNVFAASTGNNVAWRIVMFITRVTATSQLMVTYGEIITTAAGTRKDTPAEDLTGPVDITVRLTTSTQAGDITFDQMIVELLE